MFLQHRTMHSSFSGGVWYESMATRSEMATYTISRTVSTTSSMLQAKCWALIQLSCRILLWM